MFTPENTAILRSLCDIADRARAEVRFGDRDWWRERCRYVLPDVAPAFAFAGRLPKARDGDLRPPYEVLWVRPARPGGAPFGGLELIMGFDEAQIDGDFPELTALVHARASRKLWLAWHPTLAAARSSHAQIKNWLRDSSLAGDRAIYLFASVVRERKRLLFSLLKCQ